MYCFRQRKRCSIECEIYLRMKTLELIKKETIEKSKKEKKKNISK